MPFTMNEADLLDKLLNFMNNLTIKNSKLAEQYETAESAKLSSEYLLVMSGIDTYGSYIDWPKKYLKMIENNEDKINQYFSNPTSIPEKYRERLLQLRRNDITSQYEEKNNYYRTLNGLPFLGEEPLKNSAGKYVTELNSSELYLFERDELQGLLKKYEYAPNVRYLNYLGDNKISFYDARTAKSFYILSYKKYIFEEEIDKKIIELYYENLAYVLRILYNSAFREYEYYDNFISLLIVLMTIQKFISEQYNYAIRRDFFDLEKIKNTFLSYGLPFYEEIPIRYQQRIIKNLNYLLKYKGTDKVLIDIVNLFGFENTQLYKYYLLKNHKHNADGSLTNFPNDKDNYDLVFAQVPLDSENIANDLKDTTKYIDYSFIVSTDPYWGKDPSLEFDDDAFESLKNEILEREFNYINTKYMSLNTLVNFSQANFEACYFFNLINKLEYEGLLNEIKFISNDIKYSGNEIRLFDCVNAIYYLIYRRFGYDDVILYTPTQIGTLYGFNFDGDMEELLNFIKERSTVEVDGTVTSYDTDFITEEELKVLELPSLDQQKEKLIDLYFNSKTYYNLLKDKMIETDDYQEYKAYEAIFTYNMYSEAIKDLYEEGENNYYQTYHDYLVNHDIELFEFCELNSTDKETTIKAIDTLISAMESYINSDKFDYLFASLSNVAGDLIKTYMLKMIVLFKAYTVELKTSNFYYLFDDALFNRIKLLSLLHYNSDFTLSESATVNLRIKILEKNFFIKEEKDLLNVFDYIVENIQNFNFEDHIEIDLDDELAGITSDNFTFVEKLINEYLYSLLISNKNEYNENIEINNKDYKIINNDNIYRSDLEFIPEMNLDSNKNFNFNIVIRENTYNKKHKGLYEKDLYSNNLIKENINTKIENNYSENLVFDDSYLVFDRS